jgi:hypothetical protein
VAQVKDGFATLETAEQAAKAEAAKNPGAVVLPLGTVGYMVVLKHEVKTMGMADPIASEVLAQFRIKPGNGNGNANGKKRQGG